MAGSRPKKTHRRPRTAINAARPRRLRARALRAATGNRALPAAARPYGPYFRDSPWRYPLPDAAGLTWHERRILGGPRRAGYRRPAPADREPGVRPGDRGREPAVGSDGEGVPYSRRDPALRPRRRLHGIVRAPVEPV